MPVVVVTDKDKADFFFSGYCNIYGDHHVEANVKAVNKDGVVVFAYDFNQDYTVHGKQSAAEACAKNLKKHGGPVVSARATKLLRLHSTFLTG